MPVRKNQSRLTQAEWRDFIAAVDATHGMGIPAPRYRDFVRVHTDAMTTAEGMNWGVHTMQSMGMVGRNFLAWHRQFLYQLELRLQVVNPRVTIPYWDWTRARTIPAPLRPTSLQRRWGVTRAARFDASQLPTGRNITVLNANTTFSGFQSELEDLHNGAHRAVGGTMMTAASPADPLFWLHHAFIDRIWARWQQSPKGAAPSNRNERLLPARVFGFPMFGNRVATVLNVSSLGYSYT
jgi:tyrosinase